MRIFVALRDCVTSEATTKLAGDSGKTSKCLSHVLQFGRHFNLIAFCFSQEEKKSNATRIAESRARHMKFLKDALVLQIENKRAQLLTQGVDEDKLQDEISVTLMADLQEKQMTESNAMSNVLGDRVSQGMLSIIPDRPVRDQ